VISVKPVGFSFEDKANINQLCEIQPDIIREKVEEIYLQNDKNLEKTMDKILNLDEKDLELYKKPSKADEEEQKL